MPEFTLCKYGIVLASSITRRCMDKIENNGQLSQTVHIWTQLLLVFVLPQAPNISYMSEIDLFFQNLFVRYLYGHSQAPSIRRTCFSDIIVACKLLRSSYSRKRPANTKTYSASRAPKELCETTQLNLMTQANRV